MLTTEDKFNIHELISLHGHLTDSGRLDELSSVFATDVVYDLKAFDKGILNGVAAMRNAALALGEANPVGHHVTNIIVNEDEDGTVRTQSKGIGIRADGSCGSLVYHDVLKKQGDGWRIIYRKITVRKIPLQA